MSEEIKVGEYIRLKRGEIFKIDENTTNYFNSNKDYITNEIVKHIKNIIDLIEVGDYVNGKKIESIIEGNWKSEGVAETILCFEIDFPIEKGLRCYHNCDIKSIVTKEQFSEMEYKV